MAYALLALCMAGAALAALGCAYADAGRAPALHDPGRDAGLALPVRDAVALPGLTTYMPPAAPLAGPEFDIFSPFNNTIPEDRHPGLINDLGYDPESGRLTVIFRDPDESWNWFGSVYAQNQTFVYGCYDHVEPTLLYVYQYRGTQQVNGTPRLVLAGIEAYTQEPVRCTSELMRASTDAYDAGRFGADPGSRDHPPLPGRDEVLSYQKYLAPLPDRPPVSRAGLIMTDMLGSVSHENTVIAGLRYHPENGTITAEYDGGRLGRAHSQNYSPGQTLILDCAAAGPFVDVTLRRYLGTGDGGRYLAYADSVATSIALPCSDPGLAVHMADVYGRHWPDERPGTIPGIKEPERADYAAIAGADPVLEPRVLELPADPPRGGYDAQYNTFGYTSAEHNPGDDSVTLTYENLHTGRLATWRNCGEPVTGLTHTQTYHVNQTFAYCCRNSGDHTEVDLYQYRGSNMFHGERGLVFVHFEVEVPGTLPCSFPGYLEHTVDIYDAGGFDDLYDLRAYGGTPEGAGPRYATHVEPIMYPVLTSPPGVVTWPVSAGYGGEIQPGQQILLYDVEASAYNPDGSLTLAYRDPGAQGGVPGADYARTYAPGQTFLVDCANHEGTTYLRFYSYRGTEVISGEEHAVLYYFSAHTRAPAPCPYPDYLEYSVDAYDAGRFDRQYHLNWYRE